MRSYETVLGEGDIVKIDMGCRTDGFIVVATHTHVIQEGPLTCKNADVIGAANTAAEVAMRLAMPGKKDERGRRGNGVEKVIERRQRRMIKNIESAARSRQRKQVAWFVYPNSFSSGFRWVAQVANA